MKAPVNVCPGAFGVLRVESGHKTDAATLAHMRMDDILSGAQIFGLFADSRLVGTVMLDGRSSGTCFMERLAVLPEYRCKGYGRMLIDHICAEVKKRGEQTVSIAIIDEHIALKRWYEKYGFCVTHTKRFDHLAFTVCFMKKAVIE